MPTADSTGWTPEPRKVFRTELKSVRKMVIDYSLEYPGDFQVMKMAVKIVSAIDALEKNLETLAYYVRHEDTRADDRDREAEIHHARYGF